MELLKFKVTNFKTIEETDWITTNEITCLVGENESGKTNVLTALLKLNPADNDTKIDLLSDYPRQKYTEEREIASTKKFIEAIFRFDDPFEIACKNEIEGDSENKNEEETITIEYVRIQRFYSGEYKIYGIKKEKEIDEQDKHIEVIDDKEKILEIIPKFVYYASYANLNSELYLPNIINNLGRYNDLPEKEKNKAKTLKVLFDYVKLSPDEILNLGKESINFKTVTDIENETNNKRKREIMLSSASARFTRDFKEWWKQGNYIFKFSADGNYFRIWVSDDVRPEEIELENRSSGLQWFFSFFLVFITEDGGNNYNSIILLDEPGHTLHPMAQRDLSNFFNSLAKNNQLLYTTHSPFLVDSMNIINTKVVYSDDRGITNVSDNLMIKKKAAQKSIYPVNSAIGITISDTMLIGTKPIIVEGISDQIYLTYIKRKLMQNKKITLDTELVFMPVGGTKNIKPVVSIITGKDEELPVVLIDCDESGNQKKISLSNSLYKDSSEKLISVEDYLIKKCDNSEIEDIMDSEEVESAFNREYHAEELDFEYNSKSKDSIVVQMEKFAAENDIVLEDGWKVKVARRYVQKFRNEDDSLVEKWKFLFEKFLQE